MPGPGPAASSAPGEADRKPRVPMAEPSEPRARGGPGPPLLGVVRVLVLVALLVAGYLAWLSLSGTKAVGCGPDSGCDRVLRSRWAWWFGVPVSLLALPVYFAAVVATFRLGKPRGAAPATQAARAGAWQLLVCCSLLFLGAGLWFIGVQRFLVKAWCPFCMAAHGCGMAAAALVLFPALFRQGAAGTMTKWGPTAGLAAAGLAALVAGQTLHSPETFIVTSIPLPGASPTGITSTAAVPPPVNSTATTAPVSLPATNLAAATSPTNSPAGRLWPVYAGRFQLNLDEVPLVGPAGASNVMVSLFDYTCHFCRLMHGGLLEAQRTFSNHLALACLVMPLDPACNPLIVKTLPEHTNACQYARLSLAVWLANRSRMPEFEAWMFAGEQAPPLAAARELAGRLVGSNALERALASPWIDAQLRQNIAIYELANRAGQGAMPQLIVGNKVAVGSLPSASIYELLAGEWGMKTSNMPVTAPTLITNR